MSDRIDLLLINSVIEATLGEIECRGLSLGSVTRRAFSLVQAGERDFDKLRIAVLDESDRDLADL